MAVRLFSFPGFLLAVALVCVGLAVRDFFFQSADQFVTVHARLTGNR